MFSRKVWRVALMAAFFAATNQVSTTIAATAKSDNAPSTAMGRPLPLYEQDRLLLLSNAKFYTKEAHDAMKAAIEKADCKLIEDGLMPASSLYYIQTQPGKMQEAMTRLKAIPETLFVQPNWIERPCSGGSTNPNLANQNQPMSPGVSDPYYASEWHLSACHVPYQQANKEAQVFLIDRGGSGNSDINFGTVDSATMSWGATGDPTHSTPLATTIAATTGNNSLTAGILHHALLNVIACGGSADGATDDRHLYVAVARGVTTCGTQHRARPFCIPFNVAPPYSLSSKSSHPILHNLMKESHDNQNAMFFVAAGNNGAFDPNPWVPYINVVTAVDQSGKLCQFSNWGNNVSFTAPGQDIYCSDKNSSLLIGKGTSYSAAICAATAALIRTAGIDTHPGQFSAADYETLMRAHSQKNNINGGWTQKFGYGIPDCKGTMAALDKANGK